MTHRPQRLQVWAENARWLAAPPVYWAWVRIQAAGDLARVLIRARGSLRRAHRMIDAERDALRAAVCSGLPIDLFDDLEDVFRGLPDLPDDWADSPAP